MADLWFWQTVVSPHMAALASACAARGHRVTYVAQVAMTEDRLRQGWAVPEMSGVVVRLAGSATAMRQAAKDAVPQAIHLCQGLRGNGLVGVAQRALRKRRARQWVVMETVEDSGWRGAIKRLLYRGLFLRWHSHLQGVLATGWRSVDWVRAQGMPSHSVFPFAYFLPEAVLPAVQAPPPSDRPFRVLFVGQLIELKRLGLLLDVLAAVSNKHVPEFSLQVIGSGPLDAELRAASQRLLGERVEWMGALPMHEVRRQMTAADVLVLPSRYDGWGAVVSEALMAGTPVIASDACGSAGVVQASGAGGVFCADDRDALEALLVRAIDAGPWLVPARRALAGWAQCLGAHAGAAYLERILAHTEGRAAKPLPPWQSDVTGGAESMACVA
ncbi:MAG TPA: glycosyltransferase [Thermomonas sp.]